MAQWKTTSHPLIAKGVAYGCGTRYAMYGKLFCRVLDSNWETERQTGFGLMVGSQGMVH